MFPAFVDTEMAKRVPLPKLSPAELAASVLAALRTGREDVDPVDAARIAAELARDPRSVERELARLLAPKQAA